MSTVNKKDFNLGTVAMAFKNDSDKGGVYISAVNRITKELGEATLFRSLKEEHYVEMIRHLRGCGDYKESSLIQIWTAVRKLQKYAQAQGIIDEEAEWPFPKKEMKKVDAVPDENQDKMLHEIRENDEAVLMEIMMREDLTLKELIALRASDVDLRSGCVTVSRVARISGNQYHMKEMKNSRQVVLSETGKELMRQAVMARKKNYLPSCGKEWKDCEIFADRNGQTRRASYYIFKFRKLSEECGVEITPRTLSNMKIMQTGTIQNEMEAQQVTDCDTETREEQRGNRKYQAIPENEQKAIMRLDSKDMENAFLQIKLMTGTRTGEMRALQWKHVLWGEKKILIQDQIAGEGGVRLMHTTKNYRQREINLIEPVARVLSAIREKSEGILSPEGGYDFVFCDAKGYPLKTERLQERLCRTLGRRNVYLHSLRSTAATVMYNVSGDVRSASELLGHGDPKITAEHYIDTDINTAKTAGALTEYYRWQRSREV